MSPHTVRRTAALAADTDGDRYKLSLLLAGQALVVQDGREAVLRPGDFALYDCSRPYTIEGAGGFRMLVCMLPRAVLGLEPARVGRMTATRIRGDGGIAWAVAPFLERLADLAICGEVPEAHDRVVESVVELVESLCASVIESDGGVVPPRGPSFSSVRMRTRSRTSATRRSRPARSRPQCTCRSGTSTGSSRTTVPRSRAGSGSGGSRDAVATSRIRRGGTRR